MKYFLLFLLIASSIQAELIYRTQVHMGTFVTLSLSETSKKYFAPAFNIVKTIDEMFSTYKKTSMSSQLNRTKNFLHAPSDFMSLLEESRKMYQVSQGFFSIAIGDITKNRFHFGESKQYAPSSNALNSAHVQGLGFRLLGDNHVKLDDNITLDFGGIAKGFAVDKIKSYLIHKKVNKFQIALSGDIYCQGQCNISIQSPFYKDKKLLTLHLKDCAISTSGNYERYVKSKSNNHLINPYTKRPQQEIASLTLYSTHYSNTFLDAMATALSVMPHSIRMKTLSSYPEINYYIVTNAKKIYTNVVFL